MQHTHTHAHTHTHTFIIYMYASYNMNFHNLQFFCYLFSLSLFLSHRQIHTHTSPLSPLSPSLSLSFSLSLSLSYFTYFIFLYFFLIYVSSFLISQLPHPPQPVSPNLSPLRSVPINSAWIALIPSSLGEMKFLCFCKPSSVNTTRIGCLLSWCSLRWAKRTKDSLNDSPDKDVAFIRNPKIEPK